MENLNIIIICVLLFILIHRNNKAYKPISLDLYIKYLQKKDEITKFNSNIKYIIHKINYLNNKKLNYINDKKLSRSELIRKINSIDMIIDLYSNIN